jgi:hypothetical protein
MSVGPEALKRNGIDGNELYVNSSNMIKQEISLKSIAKCSTKALPNRSAPLLPASRPL